MRVAKMKFRKRSIGLLSAVALAGLSLGGCVYYPNSYGYGGGYYGGPAYYAPPVYGSVVIGGGGWRGGGWGRWH